MNRITGFTDPDFGEDEYAPEETAYWSQDLSGRGDLKEIPAKILLGIAAACFGLLLAAVVVLAVW